MAEGNGTIKMFTFVGTIIGGMVVLILLVYNTVYSPLSLAIAQDCKSSMERDAEVKKDLEIVTKEQQGVNQEILVALASIKSDIGYIKEKVK